MNRKIFFVLALSLFLSGQRMDARDYRPEGRKINTPPANSGGRMANNCLQSSSRVFLDINNVRAMLLNAGDLWWDLDNPQYEVPKQDDITRIKRHSIFAGGLWIGGVRDGDNQLAIAAVTYRNNPSYSYWPGPVDVVTRSITSAECLAFNRHFKINRLDVDNFVGDFFDGLITDIRDVPDVIRFWPARGNPYLSSDPTFNNINVNRALAPFEDFNGDGIYDPLSGDYPQVLGNQMIWWVMNDVGNVKNFPGQTPVNIGMEIRVEAFGFQSADARNDMTFYRNILINRGVDIINRCYFAQWVDPDLGFPDDDYVQCDVPRGLGICFNGDDFDDGTTGYGENPPTVGIDFFIGPIADPGDGIDNNKDGTVDEITPVDLGCSGTIVNGEPIIMSNFVYYNIGGNPVNGDPDTPLDHYRYMQSIWKTGDTMTFDFQAGLIIWDPLRMPNSDVLCKTSFMFPNNTDQQFFWSCGGSVQNPGGPFGYPAPNNFVWNEVTAGNPPGDRRFIQSAGAFTLQPGANNETTIAVVWAREDFGGALGSINKLKAASDQAQELFDNCFDNIEGPNAPDVFITELDQQVILSFTPDEYIQDGNRINTFSYQETDRGFPITFQGYMVYQLADNTVQLSDLNNPNRARLIAQSDVKDGIGRMVNLIPAPFEPTDPAFFVPTLMVEGADQGIENTVTITEDVFSIESDRRIVNYKTYFFTVIAYGYSRAPVGTRGKTEFVLGTGNVNIYTAIPSKRIGTILNATNNEAVQVTRIGGIGNSGNPIEITDDTRNAIIQNFAVDSIQYSQPPFEVKIYDPTRVVDAEMSLKMFSRLEVIASDSTVILPVKGDTIVSVGDFSQPLGNPPLRPSRRFLQVPGIAVVDSVLNQRPRLDLFSGRPVIAYKLRMLNAHLGGTFKRVDDLQNNPSTTIIDSVIVLSQPIVVLGRTDTIGTNNFEISDVYELQVLSQPGSRPISSNSPISIGNNQIFPDLGISINVSRVPNPTEIYAQGEVAANGLQSITLAYADPDRAWLGLLDTTFAFRTDEQFQIVEIQDKPTDDNGGTFRRNLLNGSVVPYMFTTPIFRTIPSTTVSFVNQFAASYPEPVTGTFVPEFRNRMEKVSRIGNVDVVFTDNPDLWTRVPVLQHQFRQGQGAVGFLNQNRFRLLKSALVSVNKTFEPDSNLRSPFNNANLSRGMSWFPGYAIDLDRGIRLNMAFAEDRSKSTSIVDANGRPVGNNLQWEPNDERDADNNFIYVLNTPYDGGTNIERDLDSISPYTGVQVNQRRVFDYYLNTIDWVMLFRRPIGAQIAETETTIKIRLDKTFNASFSTNGELREPTYLFTVKGKTPQKNVREVISNQLDIIRVTPNPYYAYSQYERNQVDNRIKIVNLPNRATIDIYTINGTLVRRFEKDDAATFIDWDMQNGAGIPIAGGVYLIHVTAPGIGERTLKWFGVTRPLDLDTF